MELDPNKNHRVFTGIQLPGDLSQLIERKLKNYDPFKDAVRLANFKTIHFTLHFFSSLTVGKIEQLNAITSKIAQKWNVFNLRLQEPGFFPNEGHPRVFWWGIEHSEELMGLQKELNDEYYKNDFPLEKRKYIPHLTIGRFKKPIHLKEGETERLKEKWKLGGEKFKAAEIKLFKSPQGPDGYESLQVFPLKS